MLDEALQRQQDYRIPTDISYRALSVDSEGVIKVEATYTPDDSEDEPEL